MLRTIVNLECDKEKLADFLHFSFLNFIFAKSHDGDFVITNVPEDCDIYKTLLGKVIFPGKVLNNINEDFAAEHINSLLDKGKAEKLNDDIFIMSDSGNVLADYFVSRNDCSMKDNEKIYLVKDNDYTYEFRNVISEHYNFVTHKIRPLSELENSLRELNIYRAFEWKLPGFAHLKGLSGDISENDLNEIFSNLDTKEKIYNYILDSSIKDESKDKYSENPLLFETIFELGDLRTELKIKR